MATKSKCRFILIKLSAIPVGIVSIGIALLVWKKFIYDAKYIFKNEYINHVILVICLYVFVTILMYFWRRILVTTKLLSPDDAEEYPFSISWKKKK